MSLKYFVHVSSISNLSDARYCSGMMVDSLGYNLDENSNDKLSIDTVKEISQWVNGVKFIAEFYNSSEKYINKVLENNLFDAIEINMDNNVEHINFDKSKIIIRIPNPNKINKDSNDYLKKKFPSTESLIIDNISNETVKNLKYIDNKYRIIINPFEEINLITKKIKDRNFGLLLKGSNEIRPGLKDYDSLSDFLESIDDSF
jgi:phosphoribosylanthranilate isomerase